jgi:hypothetical protein
MDQEAEERALLEQLKLQPDFDCLPIPASWFKKYNIPPRTTCGPKEYIHSNYAIQCSLEPKDLPPIIRNQPVKDKEGNVIFVEMVKVEEELLKVRETPFQLKDGEDFPVVLVKDDDEIIKREVLPDPENPHRK